MRFIVSTVGTSILTNLINRSKPAESTWRDMLRDSANLTQDELENEAKTVIEELADRALEKLLENDSATNRRISAELNGIYGIYNGRLPENSPDMHYLICTDTIQGQTTGNLIAEFLRDQGFNVSVETPEDLSTKDTEAFTTGTKELIRWLDDNVPRPGSGYEVIFNLVGGFKSLQGYMNTFGAFYADEVIYIFEAPTADLIKIPRLPIQIDTTVIENHILEFAMMAVGEMYPIENLAGIPETLLEPIENNGGTVAGLSAWGELIWNRTKSDLLTKELLPFPRLEYADSFLDDYNRTTGHAARVTLQETLAKVVHILEKSGGNTTGLGGGGLRFKALVRFPGFFTFRVARGIRVSCSRGNGTLKLHRYGARNIVNSKPN